jgi:Protein of unknown function (DUF2934)
MVGRGTLKRLMELPGPPQIEIVRRAYQLWQQAGEPEGRDQEFYLQAERELQGQEERGDPAKGSPDDI